MADLDLKLERKAADSNIQVRRLEGDSSQQLTKLDSKTQSLIKDTRHAVDSTRIREETERERLEARLMQSHDKALSARDLRLVRAPLHTTINIFCIYPINF